MVRFLFSILFTPTPSDLESKRKCRRESRCRNSVSFERREANEACRRDVAGTKNAVIEIIKLCYEAWAWKTLNDQIVLLSKRRGQVKQAVTAMIQQAMDYIDDTPNTETRIELIKTLMNSVSTGKIYVEIERARLIKRLAKINEEQGLIAEAADLMQEIAVQTFGAMVKTEKIAFVLEQFACVWTAKITCVPKSSQEKIVLEHLMPILQRRRKN